MIEEKIFSFFGSYLQIYDENRELDPSGAGRGTLQRYQELLGSEIDDNLLPKIQDLLKNTYPNSTIIDVFIPLWEQSFGLRQPIYNSIIIRRKVLPYIPTLNRNRGKLSTYVFLFLQLGFTIEIALLYNNGSFDDGLFDLANLDSFFNTQVNYTITLTCIIPFLITPEIEIQVQRIVNYNNPINCVLDGIIYLNTL